jgi:hypothetical protein
MADQFDDALLQQFLTGQMAQTNALNAIASRPQKQTQVTTTAPVEFADMLARRNQIGAERAMLNEALKQRETFGYGLANALASMPAQQGAGSWLGDFARGFGSAFNARANAAIDRAKQDYEAAQADLATALAFDKAMGDVQQQNISYTAVPYATGKTGTTTGGGTGSTDKSEQAARMEVGSETLADVYKTISNNELLFSKLAPAYLDANSRALTAGVEGQGIEKLGRNEFQYLQSIMPKGFATTLNTAKEQEIMRPYTTMFTNGTGTQKIAAIKGAIGSIYDFYASEARRQGFDMPISRQDYINSRLESGREYNPAYFTGKSTDMYKNGDTEQTMLPEQKVGIKEGQEDEGYRFKGGNPNDPQNWEKI